MRAHVQKDTAARAVDAVRGTGKALPAHVQQRAAADHGFGFGHVRVHDEPAAHGAARSLHAAAFTIGGDIGFAAGRYDPGSEQGEALLQHELRHVAQQHWAAASLHPQVDPADSVHERDAREPDASHVPKLSEQRIQCAPEEEQFSLGTGLIDTIGQKATSDASWPFIKAVLEGFVGGLKSDVKAGRADAAKTHLHELLRPWNAAKFYGGYLVGLVIGLVSPITDLVKGVIGLVKLGGMGLEWLAKWSPVGVAISAERRSRIAQLTVKLNELMGELGASLAAFVSDPKSAAQKFSGFLDGLMQMALSKARSIGAGAAHSLFDFLDKDFYEMGKGIGEIIGTLIAQALLLVFSAEIGALMSKGASFVGKAAEFVAGKAVEAFNWIKGIFVDAVGLLRDAAKGALQVFQGVINKALEAFDALVALFSEAAAADIAGEKVAAGVEKGGAGQLSNIMESRMVKSTRTSPATVADLTPPKIHPSNVGKDTAVPKSAPKTPKPLGEASKPSSASTKVEESAAEERLKPAEQSGKNIKAGIDYRLRGDGNLRAAAREVHDLAHMNPSDIKTPRRLGSPMTRTQSTVALAEVELPDGTRVVYGSGSSNSLSPIQKRALGEMNVNVVNGPLHAEQNIARALPEGSKVRRWGISWAGGQRPDPCTLCRPIVEGLGGIVE